MAELTMNDVAAVPPNETAVAPMKLVPVMMKLAPPKVEPVAGLTPVTDGALAWKVKWSAVLVAENPPGVVTVTSTVPAKCAGVTAVIKVSELTANEAAATAPNETAVAPVNPAPLIVTVVPPEVEPPDALRLATVGGRSKAN